MGPTLIEVGLSIWHPELRDLLQPTGLRAGQLLFVDGYRIGAVQFPVYDGEELDEEGMEGDDEQEVSDDEEDAAGPSAFTSTSTRAPTAPPRSKAQPREPALSPASAPASASVLYEPRTTLTTTYCTLDFRPVCLTCAHGVVAAGGQHGELALRPLQAVAFDVDPPEPVLPRPGQGPGPGQPQRPLQAPAPRTRTRAQARTRAGASSARREGARIGEAEAEVEVEADEEEDDDTSAQEDADEDREEEEEEDREAYLRRIMARFNESFLAAAFNGAPTAGAAGVGSSTAASNTATADPATTTTTSSGTAAPATTTTNSSAAATTSAPTAGTDADANAGGRGSSSSSSSSSGSSGLPPWLVLTPSSRDGVPLAELYRELRRARERARTRDPNGDGGETLELVLAQFEVLRRQHQILEPHMERQREEMAPRRGPLGWSVHYDPEAAQRAAQEREEARRLEELVVEEGLDPERAGVLHLLHLEDLESYAPALSSAAEHIETPLMPSARVRRDAIMLQASVRMELITRALFTLMDTYRQRHGEQPLPPLRPAYTSRPRPQPAQQQQQQPSSSEAVAAGSAPQESTTASSDADAAAALARTAREDAERLVWMRRIGLLPRKIAPPTLAWQLNHPTGGSINNSVHIQLDAPPGGGHDDDEEGDEDLLAPGAPSGSRRQLLFHSGPRALFSAGVSAGPRTGPLQGLRALSPAKRGKDKEKGKQRHPHLIIPASNATSASSSPSNSSRKRAASSSSPTTSDGGRPHQLRSDAARHRWKRDDPSGRWDADEQQQPPGDVFMDDGALQLAPGSTSTSAAAAALASSTTLMALESANASGDEDHSQRRSIPIDPILAGELFLNSLGIGANGLILPRREGAGIVRTGANRINITTGTISPDARVGESLASGSATQSTRRTPRPLSPAMAGSVRVMVNNNDQSIKSYRLRPPLLGSNHSGASAGRIESTVPSLSRMHTLHFPTAINHSSFSPDRARSSPSATAPTSSSTAATQRRRTAAQTRAQGRTSASRRSRRATRPSPPPGIRTGPSSPSPRRTAA